MGALLAAMLIFLPLAAENSSRYIEGDLALPVRFSADERVVAVELFGQTTALPTATVTRLAEKCYPLMAFVPAPWRLIPLLWQYAAD